MSPQAILGHPQAIYEYDIAGYYAPSTAPAFLWNNDDQFMMGVIGRQNWTPTNAGTSTPRVIETNNSVGGGAGQSQEAYKGLQAHRLTGGGAGRVNLRWGNVMIMPLIDGTDLPAGYANPSWRRVQRFQWGMSMGVGDAITDEGGMLYAANPGGLAGNTQWPSGASTIFNGGFGVIGDGLGDWQWASFAVGPPPNVTTEAVDLSGFYGSAEDWNTFEIVTVSASGDRASSLDLYINGALALTRNWVDAPVLFALGPSLAVENYHYIPTFQSGLGGDMFLGDWHYRCGRFLPDGRELLT